MLRRTGSVKLSIKIGSPVLGSNRDRDTSDDALVLFCSAKANRSLGWTVKVTATSAGTFGSPSNMLWVLFVETVSVVVLWMMMVDDDDANG
jgi:hypothetical protein